MNWSLVIGRWSLVIGLLVLSAELFASEVLTVAGTGKKEYSGDGGLARDAGAGEPYGLTIGPDGSLYFCDIAFHVIRRVDKDGRISTVAGSGKKVTPETADQRLRHCSENPTRSSSTPTARCIWWRWSTTSSARWTKPA